MGVDGGGARPRPVQLAELQPDQGHPNRVISDVPGGSAQVAQESDPAEPVEPDLREEQPDPLESLPARARRNPTSVLGHYSFSQGGPIVEITDADFFDLADAQTAADTALNDVRQLEPDWQPGPSAFPPTVNGELARLDAEAAQANARLQWQNAVNFGHNGPPENLADPASRSGEYDPKTTFDQFRRDAGMSVLDGEPAKAKSDGTVARATVDGVARFGMNSKASGYTDWDFFAAKATRGLLLQEDSSPLNRDNLGWMPNDSLLHAEATSLIRSARAHGGSLEGKTVIIDVDRQLCESCIAVLPSLAYSLGDPVVVLRDPSGQMRVAKGKKWY